MTVKTNKERLLNLSLMKGLRILDSFGLNRSNWGIRELSRELNINATTITRLVTTLQAAGYLEQESTTRRYRLGPRTMRLANLYLKHNPLPKIAKEVLDSYSDRFEYNYYLGRLHNYEVIYIAVADGHGPIKVILEPGSTAALHATAMGKAILASQSDDYIHDFLQSGPLPQFTEHTISDPNQLWTQIREIREHGFACNEGEVFVEMGAIGVPIHDPNNQTRLAVSCAYPTGLMDKERIPELVLLAKEIASEISMRYFGDIELN